MGKVLTHTSFYLKSLGKGGKCIGGIGIVGKFRKNSMGQVKGGPEYRNARRKYFSCPSFNFFIDWTMGEAKRNSRASRSLEVSYRIIASLTCSQGWVCSGTNRTAG